jgi:glycosyltransferase involved in cell wall biosynthesis
VRILLLASSPVLPPTHGSRVRTWGLATGLAAAGAWVEVLQPWAPGPPGGAHDGGVRWRSHLFAAGIVPFVARDRRVPSLVAHSWQPWSWGPRRRLRAAQPIDVLQLEQPSHAPWMDRVPARLRVYSAHNVETDVLAERGAARRWLRRMAWLEGDAVRSCDVLLTCTAADGRALRRRFGGQGAPVVVPNGHDVGPPRDGAAMRARLGIPPSAVVLVFVGSAGRWNAEAAEWLAGAMPDRPGAVQLLLAGRCCDTITAAVARSARVHALGHVADLGAVLAAADLGVNPVRAGSGSNGKMATYLGAGLPVLTTPVGARGFEEHADRLTILPREAMAAAMDAIAASGPPPRAPGAEELSWEALGRRLHDVYAERLRVVR